MWRLFGKRVCEKCRVEFSPRYGVTKKVWDKRRFCSPVCFSNPPLQKKCCEICKITFLPNYRMTKAYWDNRRFCSKTCMNVSMKGKLPKNYEALRKMPITEATRLKISEVQRGEKSYHWNPNREEVFARASGRITTEFTQRRKKVWLRDNFKCKIANQDCSGRIEAHHILPWRDFVELRYEINN